MSRTTGLGPAALVAVALAAAAMAPAATASTYDDSSADGAWTRGIVIPFGLQPPARFAPIGIVDDVVDTTVSDVAQARVLARSPGQTLDHAGQGITAHGTEVASVAAAIQDGVGVVGIAPGAPLLSWGYKEVPNQDPTCDEVTDGVVALAGAGAKVINLSLESATDCPELRLAIGLAYGDGALVVASAGNDGTRSPPPTTYPAVYPHVLTVGALNLGLQPADFSTPGAGVDLVAPGEAVPVALPPALDDDGTPDGVTVQTGTSFAAPIVSGLASWLIAARPGLQPSQYADLLRATAKDESTPGWDAKTGWGLPQLKNALTARVPAADRYEPNDTLDEVDGTGYDRADPYRSGTLRATIQPVEDPADVYRVRVEAHGRVTASLTGGAGAKVYAYSAKAKDFTARPVKTGSRTLTVRNTTNKAATYYVAVREPAIARPAATSIPYTLKLER